MQRLASLDRTLLDSTRPSQNIGVYCSVFTSSDGLRVGYTRPIAHAVTTQDNSRHSSYCTHELLAAQMRSYVNRSTGDSHSIATEKHRLCRHSEPTVLYRCLRPTILGGEASDQGGYSLFDR